LNLIDRVRRYAARHELWSADVRVVAAVSGGSDSVAQAWLLRELAASGELVFAAIAHLNHHVRGADADADAVFCRELAERLGVPAIIGDADVRVTHRLITFRSKSPDDMRGGGFSRGDRLDQGDRVAVAHTRDDQAETVILRLARGAGSSGPRGMTPRREHVIRPLLDVDAIGAAGLSPRDARDVARGCDQSRSRIPAIASATR
jgi:tRNA(Ile)-lysidine synthase